MGRVKYDYTKEYLEEIVKDSYSMWEVMRKLNRNYSHSTDDRLRVLFKKLGISIEHFLPGGHPERRRKPVRLTDDVFFTIHPELFGYGKGGYNKKAIKRLVQLGKPYECDECHLTDWQGKPISLQLEHRNGNSLDYRKENLAFLCPNCHSQTGTFGGGNKIRVLNEVTTTEDS